MTENTTTRILRGGRLSRALAAPLAVMLALGLSACITPPFQTTGTSSGGSSDGSTTDGSNGAEGGDDEGDESGTPDRADLTASECLVGEWLVDNAHMGLFFKRMAQQGAGGGVTVSEPAGDVIISYGAGGEYSVTYDEWTLKASQDGVSFRMVRDGTDSGTYTATDDGSLTVNETSMGSVVTVDTPMGAMEVSSEPTRTTAQYTCIGNLHSVTHEGETFEAHRR